MSAGKQGERGFTLEELKQFDGKEGRPAYIAYEGKVYDVTASKLWRNGVHVRQHNAGEELTAAMPAAPHDAEVMEKVPQVGIIVAPQVETPEPAVPLPFRWSLDNHWHTILTHFPTALGSVAPVFALASLLFIGKPLYSTFQQVAFWNLAICALASVPTLLTGWLSWACNYKGRMNPIYWMKWSFSIGLIVLSSVTLCTWWFGLHGALPPEPAGAAFWAYTGLLVLHAPVVVVLGHYGGKIVYPH
jgi:predicted heme/steroid binding protein